MFRGSCVVVGLVVTGAVTAAAQAAEAPYPMRPVRVVVPFAPGGPSDILGRMTAQKLTEAMGQPYVVDNRGSAGGVVGFEIAAKAAPDGYTILNVIAAVPQVKAGKLRGLAVTTLKRSSSSRSG